MATGVPVADGVCKRPVFCPLVRGVLQNERYWLGPAARTNEVALCRARFSRAVVKHVSESVELSSARSACSLAPLSGNEYLCLATVFLPV